MSTIIHASADEFAASSGDNLETFAGRSVLDAAPASFSGLSIEADADDSAPFEFVVGEEYTLSWSGGDGGGTIENAEVIRSDIQSGGHGFVVFQGYDTSGETVQIIWTPGFDLEDWYQEKLANDDPPAFWTEDDYDNNYSHICFTPGTLIETAVGARPVEGLRAGDVVLTRDDGPQPLVWTGASTVAGSGRAAPIRFAPGALGQDSMLMVSPQHRMLLRGPMTDLLFDTPEALGPAKGFTALPGVACAPVPQITYVHLMLERHQLLFANGLWSESLLAGDVALGAVGPVAAREIGRLLPGPMRPARPLLRPREVAHVTGTNPVLRGKTAPVSPLCY